MASALNSIRQLVDSWIQAEKEHYGLTQREAVARLNDELSIRLRVSRVAEWKRGKYCPSPAVLSELLWRTLPWALHRAGINVSKSQQVSRDHLLW